MQQQNKLNLSLSREKLIIYIMMSIYPLVGMGVDLIAPSLPAISHELHITHAISQNLIAIYLLGYALGNFFVGFLSDALGRRKIIIAGFVVFVFASLLPAIMANSTVLLWARLLQGLAIGAIAVAARALLSDMLVPEKLIRIAPLMATMWGIGPVVGPVIGGYLQYYINWQAGFYFFAGYSFICLVAITICIPETHFNFQTLNFNQLTRNFKMIITHRLFVGVIILMGTTYSILITFNTLGPFLIQTQLGYTSVYFGHAALSVGLMFLLGTFTCRYLIKQYSPEKIMMAAIPIFFLIALLGLVGAYSEGKNIWIILLPTALMFFGVGILYPACMGKGMSLFHHLAGSGAAMMNLVAVLITSMTSLSISLIDNAGGLSLAGIYLGLMLLSVIIYWFLIKLPKSMISEK